MEGRRADLRVTEAGALEGGPKEGAQWVLVGVMAALGVGAVLTLAGVFWAEREKDRREAWEAEHPHEQVEPPRVPEHYRFVERDRLDDSNREVLDEIHKKREAATDLDAEIGDLVTVFVDLVADGERVRDWVVARVVWPRETYVRARVVTTGRDAAGLVAARSTIDVPREMIATVVHLTGPAPVMPKPDRSRRAKSRRRAKGQAKDRSKPSTPPPKPATVSEPQVQPSASVVESYPQPAREHADAPETSVAPQRGIMPPAALSDRHLAGIFCAVKRQWPTRPYGPDLVPERGDDVAFMVYGRDESEELVFDLLVGRINAVGDDTFDIEVLGNLIKRGLVAPTVGHGYMAGDRVPLDRRAAISIIKAAPTVAKSRLVAKSRHKRYRVRVGDLIELSPDTIRELPPDSAWQPSRSDVAVSVVEQDSKRSVVTLDGPAGEVNVALVTSTNGKPRTVCSWKFEIAENAAAGRTTA